MTEGRGRVPDDRVVMSPWTGHSKVPYHRMSPEERRAAWAAVREKKARTARKHLFAPVLFGSVALLLFVASFFLVHYGHIAFGGIMRWVSIGLLAFAVVAYVRSLFGSLSTRKDDFTPPGF